MLDKKKSLQILLEPNQINEDERQILAFKALKFINKRKYKPTLIVKGVYLGNIQCAL